MSYVTNTILSFGDSIIGGSDEEKRVLELVNAFFTPKFRNDPQWGFVSVRDPSLPSHWYGGAKSLECSLAIGAFNHLKIEALVDHLCHLCAANEFDPVATQLILMDQEEDKFRIINIDEEMRTRGMDVKSWRDASDREE